MNYYKLIIENSHCSLGFDIDILEEQDISIEDFNIILIFLERNNFILENILKNLLLIFEDLTFLGKYLIKIIIMEILNSNTLIFINYIKEKYKDIFIILRDINI